MAIIFLTAGNDTVEAAIAAAYVGLAGNDVLIGLDDRNDVLAGGAGDDTLTGNGGDDVLIGNGGTNRLVGGLGADIFAIERSPTGGPAALQIVTDFDAASDRLGLAPGLTFGDLRFEETFVVQSEGLQGNELTETELNRLVASGIASALELQTQPEVRVFVGSATTPIARVQGVRAADLTADQFVAAEEIQFAADTFDVREDGTAIAAVTVTRSFPYIDDVLVTVGATIAATDGTGQVATDLTVATVPVQFEAGELTATVELPIVNDALVEGDETLILTLQNPTGDGQLGARRTATVTVRDDDVAPVPEPGSLSFSAASYRVDEGAGAVELLVQRRGGTEGEVGATVRAIAGTATAADFTATPQTITFADGDSTPRLVRIPIAADAIEELTEQFQVVLGDLTGGATAADPASATVDILDDDAPAGVLEFSATTYSVVEGTPAVAVTVNRAGGSAGTTSAQVLFASGTAVFGEDVVAPAETITVTFADGDTTPKTVLFGVVDDGLLEETATATLALTTPTGGASLGNRSTAAIEVVDNDRFAATLNLNDRGDLVAAGVDPVSGIGFSSNALTIANFDAGGSGNFSDPLLAPGALAVGLTYGSGTSAVANVPTGFRNQVSFRYAAPFLLDLSRDPDGDGFHEVTVFDGPNATGNAIAVAKLPLTADPGTPVGAFALSAAPFTVAFNGIARSVAFGSQADKLILDDLQFG